MNTKYLYHLEAVRVLVLLARDPTSQVDSSYRSTRENSARHTTAV